MEHSAHPAATPGTDGVTIIGAGIAGVACAVGLRAAGRRVRLVERGRAPGGRMASPTLHGRRVDIGAGYFTVQDNGFADVVAGWADRGLATPWTDTFGVIAPGATPGTRSGPLRWSTPGGLRSLVRAMLDDAAPVDPGFVDHLEVRYGTRVDALPAGEVVLAMPDPQAAHLIDVPGPVDYEPAIAVVCGFADRDFSFADAAFVNDDPDVQFVADDGARRGDGAPVLVAHTTATLARAHLAWPEGAVGPVVSALRRILGIGPPVWTDVHRWTFAKPAGHHRATFGMVERDGGRVWLAGDQWCPAGSPRVESAWRSGTDLAAAICSCPSLGTSASPSRR